MRFALQVKNFADKTKRKLDRIVTEIVVDTGNRLSLRTPVKTGLARGNWQFTIAAPATNAVSFLDPSGLEFAGRIRSAMPKKAAGKVYYLTNNLPYILRLEGGSSLQAPNGMAGLTALEFPTIVARAAEKVQ